VFALLGLACLLACKPKGNVDPSIVEATQQGAWAIHETLERRIEEGSVSEADRQAALDQIHSIEDDGSVEYAYARASIAGRAAQNRGLAALDQIEEVRVWAKKSLEREPEFRARAAQRMLGTLYVLAGRHLSEGDSEEGLELLEELVELHPEDARNHLRLAEGYVFLGDPESAFEPLCAAKAGQESFAREERELLARLVEEVGGEAALGCGSSEGGE
jgi:tetratricopeptide (TPR) repeat protein